MIKTDFSETEYYVSHYLSPDAEFQKKNRDQWRNVLGTFDAIKNKKTANKIKLLKKSPILKNRSIRKTIDVKCFQREKQRIMLSRLNNATNKSYLKESDIVWSSSNDSDSDGYLGITTLRKKTRFLKRSSHLKECHRETEINWSSSNESENEENVPLNRKSRVCRFKHLKDNHYETEINWSSSNESENESNTIHKTSFNAIQKNVNSECELDSFVKEIEKDLRRSKKIKQKLTRKGGYVESFRKAINKARSVTGFLEYEQQAEIICGSKGVITEKKVSYGSYHANVLLEAGSNCYIFLGKTMQAGNNGSTVVCFLDDSNCYKVNDKNVYIQPNKVIRA